MSGIIGLPVNTLSPIGAIVIKSPDFGFITNDFATEPSKLPIKAIFTFAVPAFTLFS